MRVTILVYTRTPQDYGELVSINNIRPSSNKKSFPVHQPGGLKRAY